MTSRFSKRRNTAPLINDSGSRLRERNWLAMLLLAIATFAVFAPACANEFLNWDDNLNIWKNASFNPPTFSTVIAFWKGPFLDLYVPVTYTAWGVLSAVAMMPTPDARGSQLDPYVFHTANVIVHVIGALLVFAILRRLFAKKWPAAAGALLFAIHPLQVEPVAWITGMKDVLCGAFSLAAIWQYVVFAQDSGIQETRRRGKIHYALAIVFFILAVLSKPSAVTVPALMFVLDVLLIRKSLKKAIIALAPLFVLAIAAAGLSILFQTVIEPADGGHKLLRPLIATDTLAFYLYKLIFPWWLGVQYNRGPLTVIRAGWLYYTWIAPAAVATMAIIFFRKAPWLIAGVFLFAIAIAPVSGIVPFSFQQYATVADRYAYMAMLGPAVVLAAFLANLNWRIPARRKIASCTLTVCFLALAARSFAQTFIWHDNLTLFNNALAVNSNSALAYNYLAGELALGNVPGETKAAFAERLNRAADAARRAIKLSPNNPDGYLTLGTIESLRGDLNSAVEAFGKAASFKPTKAEALDSYGGALAAQGKPENRAKAEMLLRTAIQINPRLAKAHLNLGALLAIERGQKDPEAFEQMQLAVRLDGTDIVGQIWLLRFYMDQHDLEHALEHATAILQMDPHNEYALKCRKFLQGLAPGPN